MVINYGIIVIIRSIKVLLENPFDLIVCDPLIDDLPNALLVLINHVSYIKQCSLGIKIMYVA